MEKKSRQWKNKNKMFNGETRQFMELMCFFPRIFPNKIQCYNKSIIFVSLTLISTWLHLLLFFPFCRVFRLVVVENAKLYHCDLGIHWLRIFLLLLLLLSWAIIFLVAWKHNFSILCKIFCAPKRSARWFGSSQIHSNRLTNTLININTLKLGYILIKQK